MLKNKYVNALVNFVNENKNNFKEILTKKPYNLKNIRNCIYHQNWYMFNYHLCSSDLKNDIVRACRGIVLSIDENGIKPISVPYTKFFNYGAEAGKDIEDLINWSNAKISMKIDGMLLKTACIEEDGEKRLYFFTNGSFNLGVPFLDTNVYDEEETRGMQTFGDLLRYALKQVDDSIKIFFNKDLGRFYITNGWVEKIPAGSTLMFELVSPRNKIICEYKKTKLYLHGYRDPDLIEHDPRELSFGLKFEIPDILNASNYEDLKKILANFNGIEKEGCVVVDYSNPETPRAKIKCESYLKIKFAHDESANNQTLFKAVIFDEYDDLESSEPSLIPKIEEIKDMITKYKQWFISESKKVSEVCKGNNDKENKRIWIMWCKKNVPKQQFPIYWLMDESDALVRLEKKLEYLTTKKNGYETFKKSLPW